jgi:virginiamycin B lyase
MSRFEAQKQVACLLFSSMLAFCFVSQAKLAAPEPVKTGVTEPGIQRKMVDLNPLATFHVTGMPDWMAVTNDSVWVVSSRANLVTQLDANTNRVGSKISVPQPCSGLAFAFDSLWIPSCGAHNLVRADPVSGRILARIPAGPADSEGGITAGAGSIWLVTSEKGVLTRVDAKTNAVIAAIAIPSGSSNPLFADGFIWISSHQHNALIKVDPATNQVAATVPVGKSPRFLTTGAGSVWTLNQGDGTISRVDTETGRAVATIKAGIPGQGGEIAFGFGSVWATMLGFPMTRIDASSNRVMQQWKGDGGDCIRTGHGSVWLTNLKSGVVWRLSPEQP